jgi:23S rRNA (uracil1939-C5)-methyltransferase
MFQDMAPDAYLALKRAQIVNALAAQRLCDINVERPFDVAPGTRRRAALKGLKKSDAVELGFHASRSHRVVDMEECRVLTPALVSLLPPLRHLLSALLPEGDEAEIRMTEADNGIDLDIGIPPAHAHQHASEIARWAEKSPIARVTTNGEPLVQFASPAVRFADVEVALPPNSFLQPTRPGEKLLQQAVRDALKGATDIADLFAGCGTFALALAGQARVHAIDSDTGAVAALLAGARKAQRLKPVSAEVRDLFRRPLSPMELGRFDAAVLDPPRAGALSMTRALAGSRLTRAAYVSCDPGSFARDARILVDAGFDIEWLRPIDQFLWSSHIELVALFRRR